MLSNLLSRFSGRPDPRAIDDAEFEQAVKAGGCVVVDVREAHEFAAAHIPGSINLPMSRFDPSELPSDRPVVLICQSGMRSRSALAKARANGRDDVRHYPGGVVGWRSRGGPVTR